LLYYQGIFYQQDKEKAAKLFELSFRKGFLESGFNLG